MPDRHPALNAFEVLIGTWDTEGKHRLVDEVVHGTTTFEWLEGGGYLIQRARTDETGPPQGVMVIGPDVEGERIVQHYFDSRGVVRVYRMTFRDGLWTLARETPDFTPLDFAQRYTGSFSEDGRSITGRWEISRDGSTWERDFALDYVRVS